MEHRFVRTDICINNEFWPAENRKELTTQIVGERLASISAAAAEDIDYVINAAKKVFESTSDKKSTPSQRTDTLQKWPTL